MNVDFPSQYKVHANRAISVLYTSIILLNVTKWHRLEEVLKTTVKIKTKTHDLGLTGILTVLAARL